MRVLIDAYLPVELKERLDVPEVQTARELGWQAKKNGDLLAVAQHQFDILVTMDKGMPHQQALRRFAIAVIITRAPSNRLQDLLPLVPSIQRAILNARKGEALEVSASSRGTPEP